MSKKTSRFFLTLLFSGLLLGFGCAKAATDKIIAIVNNSVITQSELNNKIAVMRQHLERTASAPTSAAQLRKKVLDDLINKDLQIQIAERNDMKVSDQEVTEAISNIAQRNKLTLAQLQQELLKQGVKYQDFRKQIHDDILISRVSQQAVGGKVNVSEQEVEAFLRKANSSGAASALSDGKEYHLLDVLVPTSAKSGDKEYDEAKKVVADVLDQLRKGGLVEDITRKATFAGKPLVGSDLGWRDLASIPDQFKAVVPQLKQRDAAGPIVAPNGMHIIILLETRKAASIPQTVMQMTRDEAREMVYRNKMEQALKPWLQQLRATAYIKIMDNSLNGSAADNSAE